MVTIGVGELIAAIGLLIGVLVGAIKWLLDRKFTRQDADLASAIRAWKTELSGIKSGMDTKEREAREGRKELHARVDELDSKVQRDYVRNDLITTTDQRIGRLEADVKGGFLRVNERLDTIIELIPR